MRCRWMLPMAVATVALCSTESAHSQGTKGACEIRVCSLQGFEKERQDKGVPQDLINEIHSQLSSLPFKSYGVVESRTASVIYGAKVGVPIRGSDGNSYRIEVSPNKSAGSRVEVLLEWAGSDGKEVLSTKMRVVNGKTVLLGSGAGAESSIMAVRLNCN